VLAAILTQHNWRHATKDKGVSHDTMEDRRQFLFRTFDFLQHNREKAFKLDPRSFSGRHVEFLFRHYEQRAKAGTLGARRCRSTTASCAPSRAGSASRAW
jgi:hypothetical protein